MYEVMTDRHSIPDLLVEESHYICRLQANKLEVCTLNYNLRGKCGGTYKLYRLVKGYEECSGCCEFWCFMKSWFVKNRCTIIYWPCGLILTIVFRPITISLPVNASLYLLTFSFLLILIPRYVAFSFSI